MNPSAPSTHAVYRCAPEAIDEDDLLKRIAESLLEECDVASCEILLGTSGGGLELRASTSSPEMTGRMRLGRGVGLVGHTYANGKSVAITKDLESHPKYRRHPALDEPEFESAFTTVMPEASGISGVLMLRRKEPWRPTPTQRRAMEAIAAAIPTSVASWRKAAHSGSQRSKLGAVTEVTRTIANSPYLEEILQLLVHMTAQRFQYKVVTVRLLDAKREELILRATQATHKAYQRKRAIKLGESIAGRALREKKTVQVYDVQTDAEYIGHDLAMEQGLRSMVCVPMFVSKRALGVLNCYTGEPHEFDREEIEALETLAGQAAVNIEHAKLQVRTTLMQEMHHRVKNNLQQVASLLRLQLRQAPYKTLEEGLTDFLGRILAISAVHDLLSRDDLDHVGIKSIVESLVQHFQQSFVPSTHSIGFQVRGDDVYLGTTQATQVALILNELMQNALEHGFARSTEGEIHMTIEDRDGEIGLWVSNNGDLLPTGFEVEKGGLGLQIVRSLAGSLGGSFLMEDRLGWTVCEVKFTRTGGE